MNTYVLIILDISDVESCQEGLDPEESAKGCSKLRVRREHRRLLEKVFGLDPQPSQAYRLVHHLSLGNHGGPVLLPSGGRRRLPQKLFPDKYVLPSRGHNPADNNPRGTQRLSQTRVVLHRLPSAVHSQHKLHWLISITSRYRHFLILSTQTLSLHWYRLRVEKQQNIRFINWKSLHWFPVSPLMTPFCSLLFLNSNI